MHMQINGAWPAPIIGGSCGPLTSQFLALARVGTISFDEVLRVRLD
jgi:hypothetical protein